jgi:hypothetical protein
MYSRKGTLKTTRSSVYCIHTFKYHCHESLPQKISYLISTVIRKKLFFIKGRIHLRYRIVHTAVELEFLEFHMNPKVQYLHRVQMSQFIHWSQPITSHPMKTERYSALALLNMRFRTCTRPRPCSRWPLRHVWPAATGAARICRFPSRNQVNRIRGTCGTATARPTPTRAERSMLE